MKALSIIFCLVVYIASGQSKTVTESVSVSGQSQLDLEFAFADNIIFKTWSSPEVKVEVEVEINGGEHNDIFTLHSSSTANVITIEMDEDMWDKIERDKDRDWNCSWETTLNYTVYLPQSLKVSANTISGDYEFEYFGSPVKLKTISGAIDMTVPASEGLDFRAKTITGEVYSDIDIAFPEGREGLRQIVGQKIKGRISSGGEESEFETISGNIYLRKG